MNTNSKPNLINSGNPLSVNSPYGKIVLCSYPLKGNNLFNLLTIFTSRSYNINNKYSRFPI